MGEVVESQMGREMSFEADHANQVAMLLIAADLEFFRDYALSPRLEPIRPIAGLALMPFLSAFVSESATYLKQRDPEADCLLQPHRELLRTSRLRLKLLDDNRRSFAEILQDAHVLATINAGWFSSLHQGILGPVKRLRQPDLGVYFEQNEVVCTTHVALLNIGLTEKALSTSSLSLTTLGPFMRETTEDLGRPVGILLSSFGITVPAFDIDPEPLPAPIRYRDLKSARFYPAMARRCTPRGHSVCILLSSILSQVNTARLVVPLIAGQNDVAAFKTRFVSLFHAASSLHSLLEQDHAGPFLHPDAQQLIGEALHAPTVQRVRESRDLRNNLVHYRVGRRAAARLSPDLPLFGLVEAHGPEKSLTSLTQDVELGLNCIADGLRALLPPSLTPTGTL